MKKLVKKSEAAPVAEETKTKKVVAKATPAPAKVKKEAAPAEAPAKAKALPKKAPAKADLAPVAKATPAKQEKGKVVDIKSKQDSKPATVAASKYPENIPAKTAGVTYVRQDSITLEQLLNKVVSGTRFPMRLLMREDRADKKVTEFVIVYVGRWVNCIDINSTEDDMKESVLRLNKEEFKHREVAGVPFAIYERVVEKEAEEEEPQAPAKPTRKVVSKR